MKITDRIDELSSSIRAFASGRKIPIFSPKTHPSISLDNENQCVFSKIGQLEVYLIAHEGLDIFERFLNLSDATLIKINKIRSFNFGVHGSTHFGTHKRLKITTTHDKSIEFSIIGSELPVIVICLKNDEITISDGSRSNGVSVLYSVDDNFEEKLNEALDMSIPKLLERLGFVGCTEHSKEVTAFMNASKESLLIEKFTTSGFNYCSQDKLLSSVCSDLNMSKKTLINYNKKNEDESFINIPTSMISILPKMIYTITMKDSIESKVKQLMSLINFHNKLKSVHKDYNFSFKEYSKESLAPSGQDVDEYCTFDFSGVLSLTLGHQLKSDLYYESIYEYILDGESSNGYSYKFSTYIYSNTEKSKSKTILHFTNNIDYIYEVVLDEIRTLINTTISNTDDVITSRHVEVFKMAIV